MTQKTIEVIVNAEGDVEIEASGFTDQQCSKETAPLEAALGIVTDKKYKNHGGAKLPVATTTKVKA